MVERSRSESGADLTEARLEQMLGEASWLLSHAEALNDEGSRKDAAAELRRAANCEEQVACLLDAAGREMDAVVHRVSAASCYKQLGQFSRAVTLLRAALSATLADDYRRRIEQQLADCLAPARDELRRMPRRSARKPTAAR